MDLCCLQMNYFLQLKLNLFAKEFWKLCRKEKFPTKQSFCFKILLLFKSTYIYKSAFPTINLIQIQIKKSYLTINHQKHA